MKRLLLLLPLGLIFSLSIFSCSNKERNEPVENETKEVAEQLQLFSPVDLSSYPSTTIQNEAIQMLVFLPDIVNGLYRGTRFDWSGVIGSVQYKGHEYFGYWKDTHDPYVHEDLTGPVEGYIKPGLGYEEAEAGEAFIRIGVGTLRKGDETEYQWRSTYKILDHGNWTVEKGEDEISFTHELASDIGYSYVYQKTIRLKEDGFTLAHSLKNTGEKIIETDQFNHNFFMIDGQKSGPAFTLSFPYAISTEDDLKGLLALEDQSISFVQAVRDTSVFINISGYGEDIADHQVTVVNQESGAGVSFSVDQPIYRMAFWTCETTLCPENFIWLSVAPQETIQWTSDYTLFVN